MEGRDEKAIAALIVGERALFANRRRSLHSKITTLKSRNEQYRQQIVGLAAQRQASENTAKVLARDLVTVRDLYERKLVPLDRMSTIELRITDQTGEIGRLTAAMAEVEGRISENALQVIQLEDDFREAANAELREAEAQEAELIGRRNVAVDQQSRTTLRSPQAGIIQELAVFTVGGVVTPGQTLMMVVPKEDALVVDARIPPARIDEVVSDQPVTIRFSAFDRNTTPECHGTIERVSPDLIRNAEERVSYYAARILIGDRDSCLGNDQNLIPGMPVEVHIHTGDRSVWSYLMKPLLDQLNRSMRE
jgi:HlyD family secretion protein